MRAIDDILTRLARSPFRSRFHLGAKDRAYVHAKGREVVMRHGADFVARRLASAAPANDGKQTPMRGHPVFLAQHATATCCRGCLAKWHQIAAGTSLSQAERNYVLAVIGRWIDRELAASLRLRRATQIDADLLSGWDRMPHVISARGEDGAVDWAQDLSRDPEWRALLIAESDGHPIGFLQIIDCAREETHYWGAVAGELRAIDLWIGATHDLRHGFGTRMMQLAIARCFSEPKVEAVLVDPLTKNVPAHRLYEQLGFVRVERRRFHQDDCYVYRLDRGQWQAPAE